jgi:PKD domain
MSPRHTRLSRLLVAIALLAVAALASAPASGAAGTPWGDLGHSFGETEGELRHPEAALGVNPADGSVWTVDTEVVEKENAKKEKEREEFFRLQKFAQVGGAWKAVASRRLPLTEFEVGTTEVTREVEGVAFDQAKERAYVLVTEESKKTVKEEPVASELLAFSTKTNGTKIEPAAGTKTVGGVEGVVVPRTESKLTGSPVGKSEFGPDSTEKGAALIAPSGLTVNPSNHQILITGWIGAELPVLWAISEVGTIEKVWEDKTKYFEKECGCVSSPVVTSAGKILVLAESLEGPEEVVELPSTLESGTAPTRAFWLPRSLECEERVNNKETPCPFVESLANIETGNREGGDMSVGPEGDVYVHVHIKSAAEGGLQDGAVMVLNSSLQEIGWTGGGSWGSATKQCAVNETDPGNLGPALVAGYEKGGTPEVFMLARGTEGERAKVLELGSGSEAKPANCPQGSATKPQAETLGQKPTSFPVADTVTFTSKVTQANALSTEWEFGDSPSPQTVAKRQQGTTLVEHKFAKEGTFTVKETINVDDLATPTLTAPSAEVTIVAPKVTNEAATPEGGGSATLKAEVNPSGSPTKCEFELAAAAEAFTAAGVKKLACPTSPGEGTKPVAESVKATSLATGKYHFRLLAKAGIWESSQEPGFEFQIGAAGAPLIETKAATEVGQTSATLNGSVNPEGKETKSCKFEYGTALPSGKTAPCVPLPGSGKTAEAVTAKVTTGLTAGTKYEFKLIDENVEGKESSGSPLSFTTLEAATAPLAETFAAVGITQTSATLKGDANAHGETTSCHFEYGTTTAYGTSVPCPVAPGSGRSNVEESLPVAGLSPGTTYHFQLVAENGTFGKTLGGDKQFTTAAETSGGGGGGGGETGGGGGGGGTGGGGSTGGGGAGAGGVLSFQAVLLPGGTLTVAPSGVFSLKLTCPIGNMECMGAVVVKTLTAVAARSPRVAAAAKKAILTLASGSFTISAGQVKVLKLHLSAKAKKLLAKLHTVRARVIIAAHNPLGLSAPTTKVVTLKAQKKH